MTIPKTRLDVLLVDATGRLGEGVQHRLAEEQSGFGPAADLSVEVEPSAADRRTQRAALDAWLLDESLDAWLWLDRESVEEGGIEYHARRRAEAGEAGFILAYGIFFML